MTAPLSVETKQRYNRTYRERHRAALNARDRADWRDRTPAEVIGNRQRARRWYENNRQRAFIGSLQRKYGLSIEEWSSILRRQRGRCASCRFVFTNASKYTKPHVDHCHRSGKVRGLLCAPCNLTLGAVKESVARLTGLISYLRRTA